MLALFALKQFLEDRRSFSILCQLGQQADVSSLLQHEGYLLWRLRDTPGQSTLTAFPFQPTSRSAAIADASGKAHHRPAVTTPDKSLALPGQAGRSPVRIAEHDFGAAHNEPTADKGNEAEPSSSADREQQMDRHGVVAKEMGRRLSIDAAKQFSSKGEAISSEAQDQMPLKEHALQEQERLGSLGATGNHAGVLQEEQRQGSTNKNLSSLLDSSCKDKLPAPTERALESSKISGSREIVADPGNEGWQSSLESPQPLPQPPQAQPAVAVQQRQLEGGTADQQTRLEHMLPGMLLN